MKSSFLSLILTLCFIFCAHLMIAQKIIKFGKISEADMTMTAYEKAPDSKAVVLYERVVMDGLGYASYRVHLRIKILNKAGLTQANIKIPYDAKIEKAHTLNWVDGKVIPTLVDKDNIFKENVTKSYRHTSFSFPNVKVGSVIEYIYKYSTPFYFSTYHFFQKKIPVRYSEFSAKIPQYLEMSSRLSSPLPLSKNEKVKDVFRVNVSQSTSRFYNSMVRTYRAMQQERVYAFRHTFAMKDIPALKIEPYTLSYNAHRAYIDLYVSKFEGDLHQNFIVSWEEVNKESYKDYEEYFGSRAKFKQSYKLHKSLIKGNKSPKEKMQFLYTYISQNAVWNGFSSAWSSLEDLDDVMDEEGGNSGDINLLLLSLLKEAGLQANPVLIKTRSQGPVNPYLPFQFQFNHMIVKVNIDGKDYFLDAKDKDRPLSLLDFGDLNGQGFLVTKEKGSWITLPKYKSGTIYQVKLNVAEDGEVSGNMNAVYNGFAALNTRAKLDKSHESYLAIIQEEDLADADISDVTVKNREDINKRLLVGMNITSSSLAQVGDDKIYVSPVCISKYKVNPFKDKVRFYAVDLGHQIDERYMLTLNIPKGYEVDELPQSAKVNLLGSVGTFSHIVNEKPDGTISIMSRIRIKEPVIQPEDYEVLKQFFDMIVAKQAEQIVLKKIE